MGKEPQTRIIDLSNIYSFNPLNVQEEDDDRVLKVKINKAPLKIELPEATRNKNIPQEDVENPPMRDTTATMITETFFIGDEEIAYDPRFMK